MSSAGAIGANPTVPALGEPLIPNGASDTHLIGSEADMAASKEEPDLDISAPGSWKPAFKEEAKRQVLFAMPMVGMNVLQFLLNLVAVIYVGHLGRLELAASSLATTMVNISGHIMLLALASALETFCGQAYGAKQYSKVGVYTQQAIVALLLCSLPVAVFWWYMEPALLLLGQDPAIAYNAGLYARCLLPSLFASALTQPLIKFYQAQSETAPLAWCQLIALVIHIPLIYILIWPLGFGFLGAAMSASVAWWINVILLSSYLKFSGLEQFEETWSGFSWDALDLPSMWAFLKLAIPSAIMICLEYWCFEMNVIFAGLLPDPELQMSAVSIGFNTVTLSWMVPYGISAAVSTRVANELGAGHGKAARFATHVSYSLIVFISGFIFVCLVVFRRQWVSIFISEEEVIDLVSGMMPFVAWICFNDGFTGINAGAVRGIGHQHLGAIVNLAAYYCLGIPGAYLLAFVFGFGSFGLWWGLLLGQGAQVIVLAVAVLCYTNWEKEAEHALQRMEVDPESSKGPAVTIIRTQSGMGPLLKSPNSSFHSIPLPKPTRRASGDYARSPLSH